MDRATKLFVAAMMAFIAILITWMIGCQVVLRNIPLDSIGLWLLALIPISLFAGAVAITIKEW
jgi:hypothetical protein